MVLTDKALELHKTRFGKLLAIMLSLSMVFAFSGFAYGDEDDVSVSDDSAVVTSDEGQSEDETNGPGEITGETPFIDEEDQIDQGEQIDAPPIEDEEEEPLEEVAPQYAYLRFAGLADAHLELTYAVPTDIPQELDGQALPANAVMLPSDVEYEFQVKVTPGYEVNPAQVVATMLTDVVDEQTIPATETASMELKPEDVDEATYGADAQDMKQFTLPAALMKGNVVVTLSTDIRDVAYSWDHVVDALEMGNDIRLGADISIPSGVNKGITIASNSQAVKSDVTLDLAGNQITNTSKMDAFFIVPEGKTFTLKDSAYSDSKVVRNQSDAGAYTVRDEVEAGYEDGLLTYYIVKSNKQGVNTSETLWKYTVKYELGKFSPLSDEEIKNIDSDHEPEAGDGIGSLIGSGVKTLIDTKSNSTLRVENAFLNNSAESSNDGAAIMSSHSTITLNNAHVIDCSVGTLQAQSVIGNSKAASGSINMNNGSLVIDGGSIIGANKGAASGGGIYAHSSNISLMKGAVVDNKVLSSSHDTSKANVQNTPQVGVGGGICIEGTSTLSIQDDSKVSCNEAYWLGGGIYAGAETYVSITGRNAYISCNKTLFSPSDELQAYFSSMGGGGVCTLGKLYIHDCYITGNISSDAGGGVMIPTSSGTLSMTNVVVASNWAKASEGGGLYCRTGAGSVIYSGYITNNATDTQFDYGGGGIFISNGTLADNKTPDRGKLVINDPIVTQNIADGFGGGVAGCRNAVAITNNSAIYANTANEVNSTTNTNAQIGDGWAAQVNQSAPQLSGSSQDIYCAGQGDFYNNMLGGGEANWSGYTSGNASYVPKANGTAYITYGRKNITNSIEVDGSTLVSGSKFFSTLTLNASNGRVFSSDFNNANEFRITIKGDEALAKKVASQLNGKRLNVDASFYTLDCIASIAPEGTYGTSKREVGNLGIAVEVDGGTKYYHIYFTANPLPPDTTVSATGGTFINADNKATSEGLVYTTWVETRTVASEKNPPKYAIFQIPVGDFPTDNTSDPVAHLQVGTGMTGSGKGLVALTANPSDESIAKALSATDTHLYITGNYSKVNGGGIADNGDATVGHKPKDPPLEVPDSSDGSLSLTKTINTADYTEASGDITVVFNVTGYESVEDYEADPANTIYEEIVSMTFTTEELKNPNTAVTKLWTLNGLEKDNYFIIEEVTGNGSFDFTSAEGSLGAVVSNARVAIPIYVEDTTGAGTAHRHDVRVSFTNTFKDTNTYSTNAVNQYSNVGNGFTWERIANNEAESEANLVR